MLSSQKWTNPNSPASTVPSPRYGIPVGTGTLSLAPSRPADYDLSSQISHESIGSIRGWAPQEAQYGNGYGPVWSLLINNVLATCPMDSILLNFIDCRRRALLQGATELVAAGPGYPDFSGLLGLHTGQVKCPISQLLTDVIAKVETLGSLPEQTAVLYIMFSMIRVSLAPGEYRKVKLTVDSGKFFRPWTTITKYLYGCGLYNHSTPVPTLRGLTIFLGRPCATS